jgi:DNA repair/transcription protein MET18/MMS19
MIEMFAEDLFEVIACYFPVDFTPPANDPHGITKSDLVLSLRQCLSASSKFGMFCLPLLLEKISSNVNSAKLDSLETLVACSETYKAEDFGAFSEELWRAIRQEVFQPVNESIKEAAFRALASITKNMASGLNTDSSSALDKFLNIILKECVNHLKEPSLRLIRPSGLVLQSVASVTDPACVAVVNAALPVLLSKYTETMQGVHQRNILEVVLGVLKATREFPNSHDVSSPLLPFKESLLMLFYTTLNHSDDSVRCAGLSGLATLLSLPDLLTQEEDSVSARHVTELLLQDVSHVVKSESVNALSVLGLKAPSVVQTESLPLLLHHKSDGDDVNLLSYLSAVSIHLDIIQVTIPEILTRINHYSQVDTNQKKSISTSVCAFNSLSCLVKAHSNDVDIVAYIEQFALPSLISKPICAVIQDPLAEWSIYYESETLSALCSCIKNVMLALDIRSQHRVVSYLSDLFINGQTNSMNDDMIDIKPILKFQPLQPQSPWQQTQLVCLLTAVLCHCRKDV